MRETHPEKTTADTGNDFSGIVLAGGRSTRMGTDKADLLIDGRTFLENQVRKLQYLGAGEILISGRTASLPGTRSVPDLVPGLGPLGGLCSCFPTCGSASALVISVDVPLLSVSTLEELLRTHQRGGFDATILSHDGRIQPLIAVYETDTFPLLQELTESRRLAMRAYIERLRYQLFGFSGDPEELLNCNRPEDLARLRHRSIQ